MKDTIVIPIFNDEHQVICTWGDARTTKKAIESWGHRIEPWEDPLEDRRGVTFVTRNRHPVIILPRFPRTPDDVSTLAHEAVHAVEDIFRQIEADLGGEHFANAVGAIVRIVLQAKPVRKRKKV